MPYQIKTYAGTNLANIADGTINTTATSLSLPGRNYPGYGLPVDQNFVFMLENFAGTTAPTNPIVGQLWFDTSTTPGNLVIRNSSNTGWVDVVEVGGNGTFSSVTSSSGLFTGANPASNISMPVSGNILLSAGPTSNLLVSTTGTYISAGGNSNVLSVTGTGITVNGISDLGAVGNVIITGGTNGQFLQTNGSGNLTWASITSAATAGTVTTAAQPNITSVGTLTGLTSSGPVSITDPTSSTTTGTGALTVVGGVGIGGNVNAGGDINASGNIVSTSTTSSTNTTTGALVIAGGAGISGNINAGGDISGSNLVATSIIDSTSTSTGALVVAGGAGIGGNAYVGGNVVASGSIKGATTLTLQSDGSNQDVIVDPNGTGNINASTSHITNVLDPVSPQDAATKNYVDSLVNGLKPKASVQRATTVDIGGTYVNGAAGIGATLTFGIAPTVDGGVPADGDRVLVKNQANLLENGIYLVSGTGTIFTRATDSDTVADLPDGTFVFVEAGTTNAGSGWAMISAITSIGTDSIVFQQVGGTAGGVGSAGTGLTLTGSQFSITNTAVTAGIYGNATHIPQITVNAQGQLTLAANVQIVSTSIANGTSNITVGLNSSVVVGVAGTPAVLTVTATGANITGTANVTGDIITGSTTAATSTTTGALIVAGGVGIAGNAHIGANANIGGIANISNTTAATSTTTGALIVAGGVGIAGNAHIGGILSLSSYGIVGTLIENVNTAATLSVDASSIAVHYFTAGVTTGAAVTVNIATLPAGMATGKSLTVALVFTGTPTSWVGTFQIGGVAQTVNWQGGTAPTASTGGVVDAYNFTIIQTGAATYTVMGAQTKFG